MMRFVFYNRCKLLYRRNMYNLCTRSPLAVFSLKAYTMHVTTKQEQHKMVPPECNSPSVDDVFPLILIPADSRPNCVGVVPSGLCGAV